MRALAPSPAVTPAGVRRLVLEVAGRAGTGHVGSALSVVEIVAALYGKVLRVVRADDPDRDRFVLSKGHAALALYAALYLAGALDRQTLDTYCDGSGRLGVHPDRAVSGVDFSTGSLGLGLSFAVGSAFAARASGSSRRVFALLSDAELDAGATWEAVQLAAHHRLGALVAVVDANGQQALGPTVEVLDLEPLAPRFAAHGWAVREVDGHDEPALVAALAPSPGDDRPRAVIARTVSGRGVSFMEGRVEWHYLPMRPDELRRALAEQEAAS